MGNTSVSNGAEASATASKGSPGLWSCNALVIGNMIGSGFFIAPAALAPCGTVAIIGWGVMAADERAHRGVGGYP